MTFKKLILAGALFAPFLFAAAPAEAREYCREYNKTITVGGRYESGYGTACMQPDGSWMIVEARGTVDPFDDLRRQRDVVIISDQRPVYYNYGPTYRPVTYYPRARYSRPYVSPGFHLSITNYDNDRHYRGYRDRHDNRWNGRGKGHDNHHNGHGRGHYRRD
jgi:hypothetical protein